MVTCLPDNFHDPCSLELVSEFGGTNTSSNFHRQVSAGKDLLLLGLQTDETASRTTVRLGWGQVTWLLLGLRWGSIVCGPHYQTLGQAWILSDLLGDRIASESLVSRAGAGTRSASRSADSWPVTRCVGRSGFCQMPGKAPVLPLGGSEGGQEYPGLQLGGARTECQGCFRVQSWDSADLSPGALTGMPSAGFLDVCDCPRPWLSEDGVGSQGCFRIHLDQCWWVCPGA